MKTSMTKHIIRIDQRSSHKANVSTASLLSRLGAHAAARFSNRLALLKLAPVHAGILGTVAVAPGISQSALARVLGTLPSRMVTYLDELEGKGLLERRPHKNDRRNNSLYLTKAGQAAYHSTSRLAEEHQQALLAGLSKQQQMQLAALLERVADQQGLIATPALAKKDTKEPARQASTA